MNVCSGFECGWWWLCYDDDYLIIRFRIILSLMFLIFQKIGKCLESQVGGDGISIRLFRVHCRYGGFN